MVAFQRHRRVAGTVGVLLTRLGPGRLRLTGLGLTRLRLTRRRLTRLRPTRLPLARLGLTRLPLARLRLTRLRLTRLPLARQRLLRLLAGLRVRARRAAPNTPRPGRIGHARSRPELTARLDGSAQAGGGIGVLSHVPIMA